MFAVLDTNHFRELRENSILGQGLQRRIAFEGANIFACIITAEESLQGRIAFIRKHRPGLAQVDAYQRLQATMDALSNLTVLSFDQDAATMFQALTRLRLRVGTMKIASICLVHDATLLTRNLVDFEKVSGLKIANWLD